MSNCISLPGRSNVRAAIAAPRSRASRLAAEFGSGTLLSEVFTSVRAWVLVLDENFTVLRANPEAAAGLGGGSGALSRRDARQLLGELDPADAMDRIVEEPGREAIVSFEARPGGGGRYRSFRIRTLHDRFGRWGYLVTGGDELAFRGCEEDEVERDIMDAPRRALSGRPDPAVIVETAGWTIIEANAAFTSWYGTSRGLTRGCSLAPRFPDADAFGAFRREAVRQTLRIGSGKVDVLLDDGKGQLAPFLVEVSAFRVPGELRDRLVLVFEDSGVEARRNERAGRLVDELERATYALVAAFREGAHARAEDRRLSTLGASPRQVAIVRLLLEGATTKEAGAALGLSESTVNSHLSMLYRKLGALDRAGFMRLVAERGLVAG